MWIFLFSMISKSNLVLVINFSFNRKWGKLQKWYFRAKSRFIIIYQMYVTYMDKLVIAQEVKCNSTVKIKSWNHWWTIKSCRVYFIKCIFNSFPCHQRGFQLWTSTSSPDHHPFVLRASGQKIQIWRPSKAAKDQGFLLLLPLDKTGRDWAQHNKQQTAIFDVCVSWVLFWHPGFSVEAGNRRIPRPVKTKVAACASNEICLRVPNFLKLSINGYLKSSLEFSAYLEEPSNALSSLSNPSVANCYTVVTVNLRELYQSHQRVNHEMSTFKWTAANLYMPTRHIFHCPLWFQICPNETNRYSVTSYQRQKIRTKKTIAVSFKNWEIAIRHNNKRNKSVWHWFKNIYIYKTFRA